ncbi:MAE_28990/MAE_18760 family HEPN-like nuclease [Paracoccus sp. J39]|uniref:MAE_28990/MAE_18760 family HEPN-like nuclease n=1 Tax=Paracoccus sp. J39 TaxID=935848 RepID=UPI0012EB0C30|nr:MAE_28990/MAE_18760 family HEPN-like nuclease [Paracoccus sp. J39]
MTHFDEIEHDLDWREAELAVLRLFLANEDITEREKRVLFRAAWALLYAHYEGFCKFALTVYFDALKNSGKRCENFPPKTQAFALTEKLKAIRNLPPVNFIAAMRGFEVDVLAEPASFPEVDTDSNLSPKVLKRLLEDADLELESLSSHNRSIFTLVNRRNKIAHGEREFIHELDYYLQFEAAAKDLMTELALRIDEKLSAL